MSRNFRAFAPILLLLVITLRVDTTAAFELNSRWSRTATNGTSVGSQGSPITLTWSFAPDGTSIPDNPSSNAISFFDTTYGAGPGGTDYTLRPWFPRFQEAFDRITALSGVTYVYEPNDDGIAFANSTSARGSLGVRGDIRIGGKSYGEGSSTLASNYYPSYGEMMFNTDRGSWYSSTSNNYRRLRNVIMHEAMHGLGIKHVESSSSGFLIEPSLSTSFDGPQLDDLLAIQRHYGDFREKNGGNDSFGVATSLGTVTTTQSRQLGTLGSSTVISSTQTDFLSIDDNSDTDFFSFTLGSRLNLRLQITSRGTTYQVGPQDGTQVSFNSLTLSDLSLALFDTNGTSMLASANANPAGGLEEITRLLLPGTYYARVTGAQDNIQLYGIMASATTPPPANLVWAGNLSNVWNTTTANFKNAGASSIYWDLDNVTFDDTSTVKTVNLASNVSPGLVQINTSSGYVFTGAGGIVAGSVTIGGTGTVEFANSGNSYLGNTVINGGTLAITGNASAMRSQMIVNNGATLLMNSSDAGTMTSSFSIAAGGTLQIGTATSTGNVFPDNPTSIVNNGTIRVFDEESLRAVLGLGQIIVEQETTTFQTNTSFNGTVTVKPGAVARVLDDRGLGSAAASTTIESGGTVLVDASPTIVAGLKVTGDGGGSGAIRITAANNATFSGGVTLQGDGAMLQADSGATATFQSAVDGSVDQTDLILQSELGANLRLQGGLSLAEGGITKRGAGSGEVQGNVNYIGDTNVEEGSLRLLGLGTLTGELHVSQGASLEVGSFHELSASVRLSGSGQVMGDLIVPGTIAPGDSAATLTFMDDLFLANESLLEIELGGTQVGVNFDFVQVVGLAALGGNMEVSLLESFMPQLGDVFEVLNAFGGISGTLATTLPSLDEGLSWNVLYGASSVILSVEEAAVVELAGDYNEDGVVNAADFAVWRDTLGSMTDLNADGDLSGTVDDGDYPVWAGNFGATLGAASSSTAAVPEPGSFVLIALAIAAFGTIRANRRRLQSC